VQEEGHDWAALEERKSRPDIRTNVSCRLRFGHPRDPRGIEDPSLKINTIVSFCFRELDSHTSKKEIFQFGKVELLPRRSNRGCLCKLFK